MKIAFIGDVHGKFKRYEHIIHKHDVTLQLGDFGVGFEPDEPIFDYGPKHRAIRGNHDNPHAAVNHPLFLPGFGVWNNVFFVSGASSIDQKQRTIGKDWWPEEELSYEELTNTIELYGDIKPAVVASHDCPQSIFQQLPYYKFQINSSRTRLAMDRMLDIHRPNIWVFGHHHIRCNLFVENTKFMCLNELQLVTIDVPGVSHAQAKSENTKSENTKNPEKTD